MIEHEIPQTLDAPPLLLIFNGQHFICFAVGAGVGIMTGHTFICSAAGLLIGSVFSKYADTKPVGWVRHNLYFWGFPLAAGRKLMNGLDREFRP